MYDDIRIFEPRILDPRVVLTKPRPAAVSGTPMDQARRLRADALQQMGRSLGAWLSRMFGASSNADRFREGRLPHADGRPAAHLLPAAIGPWTSSAMASLIDGRALRSDAVLGHLAGDDEPDTQAPVPFPRRLAA